MFKKLFDSLTNTFVLNQDVENFVKNNDFSQYPLFNFKGHSFNLDYYLNKGIIQYHQMKLKDPETAQRLQERAIEQITRMIINKIMTFGVINEKVTQMKAFDEYCFNCGKQHAITINEKGDLNFWSLGKTAKDKIVDEPCMFVPKIIKQDINFISGDLLISDYFRIKNVFPESIEKTKSPDLNCSQGIVDEFDLYFKSKIIKVQFGSGGLSIVEHNGNLYFGHVKESCEKKVNTIGKIYHDLWATCVTEKGNLVQLLKNSNLFNSDKEINKAINETVQEKIKVKSGLYTICYSPNNLVSLIENEFEQNFDFISFKILKKE